MSKHETQSPDRIAKLLDGNWNRHKKRRIRSSMRTKGRRKRFVLRHAGTLRDYQAQTIAAYQKSQFISIELLTGTGKVGSI